MSEKLQSQITWLCNRVHNTEWSGILLWTLVSGSFEEGNAVLRGEYLYLFDIGSSAYTDFKMDEECAIEFTAFLMEHPEYITCYRGKVHSHNHMGVFHSGTDQTDLKEQTVKGFYNYYVSLIVNNKNEFDLAVSFAAEISTPTTLCTQKGLDGKPIVRSIESTETRKVVYYYEGDVETEDTVDDVLKDKWKELASKVVPAVPKVSQWPTLFDKTEVKSFSEEISYTELLKDILPSSAYSLEKMLEDLELKIEGDDVAYNKLFHTIDKTLLHYQKLDFDTAEGVDVLEEAVNFLNTRTLIYPEITNLLINLLEYYAAENIE